MDSRTHESEREWALRIASKVEWNPFGREPQRWIVEQECGHVSHWWLAADREDFAAIPSTLASTPCKGAPIIGWGEWCSACRDIVPVTDVLD